MSRYVNTYLENKQNRRKEKSRQRRQTAVGLPPTRPLKTIALSQEQASAIGKVRWFLRGALKAVWDAEGTGLLDYDRLNADRTNIVHQLDIRVDKRFFFDGWSLNFYVDLQNVYNSQIGFPPFLVAETDANDNPIEDPKNPDAYLLRTVENPSPPFFPAIGVIAEF